MEQIQELTKSEKLNISLVDIAKIIKKQLSKDYPACKFSISTQYYSGGCSLHISIMESNFKVILPFEQISESAVNKYTRESYREINQLKELQSKSHHQLSHFVENEYNPDVWNNGVFLTEEGYKLVKRIVELSNKFNWDNSDSQTDYFDVNFYLNLSIGKWDKPFKENI